MAAFDFVDSAARGYQFVWNQRKVLVHLATLPLFIKLGCFSAVILLGVQENFLRQGLLLLPSYFAEGWLLASVVRYALLSPAGKFSAKDYQSKPVVAAMLVYVLIQLVLSVLSGLALSADLQTQSPPPDPTFGTFVLGLSFLFFLVWAFRLLWIFIPVALGYSVQGFLIRIKAYVTSFYMMGTWLLCFVPLALFLVVVSQILLMFFPAQGSEPSEFYTLAIAGIQVVLELAISLVSTVAMAYGIRSIYEGNKPKGFFK